MLQEIKLQRNTILLLGGLAVFGGGLSVVADIYSAYLPSMPMSSATSVSFDSVASILGGKSHEDHLVGSSLGQYFIPFHIFGWILLFFALAPTNMSLRVSILVFSVYVTIIGTSVHASLIYAGAIARSGDQITVNQVGEFFNITTYSLVAGVLIFGVILAVLILLGRTLFPRWVVLISPLGYLVITTLLVTEQSFVNQAALAFITATGFNLPCTLLHIATTVVLLRQLE